MTYWVFAAANAVSASAAQAAAFATLPPDTLFDGRVAPVQYTKRWDDIITLTDGRLSFRQKSGMITPGAVSATLTDTQVATLIPALALL